MSFWRLQRGRVVAAGLFLMAGAMGGGLAVSKAVWGAAPAGAAGPNAQATGPGTRTQAPNPEAASAINSYTVQRVHPTTEGPNIRLPVTATNSRDPKKDETTTVIAVTDGKLEISTFPNDPSRHLTIVWTPERRQAGIVYQYYPDPMAPVERIGDPFRHALAYATYSQVYGRALGLMRYAGMTVEQLAQEAAAREQMTKEIKAIDAAVDEGTFHAEMLDKVAKTLKAGDAMAGDPLRDPAKADLARQLLVVANEYVVAVQGEKEKAIEKYMSAVDGMLSADQKQAVVNGFNATTQPARGRGGVGDRLVE